MDKLTNYIVDILEYIVGGILCLCTIALVAWTASPETVEPWFNRLSSIPDSLSLLVGATGFAIVYSLGIVMEGVSRLLIEPLLDAKTLRQYAVRPTGWEELSRFGRILALYGLLLSPQQRRIRTEALSSARGRREATRRVAQTTERGDAEIKDQLRRLRVERTAFILTAAAGMAFVVLAHWALALVALVAAVVTFLLVQERFNRYLSKINTYGTET